MKKIIQFLIILILLFILSLIAIFVFNPMNLRNKIIGGAINAYLDNSIKDGEVNEEKSATDTTETITGENVQVNPDDKSPLLNAEQEKALESYGVDVDKLPKVISPEMEKCFLEKLGQERGVELVGGSAPSAFEVIKIRTCISL